MNVGDSRTYVRAGRHPPADHPGPHLRGGPGGGRRDHRRRGPLPSAAPHRDPRPRHRPRRPGRRLGGAAGRRRPLPDLLRRPVQRGRRRPDQRRPHRHRRSAGRRRRAGGAGQRRRRPRQHHRDRPRHHRRHARRRPTASRSRSPFAARRSAASDPSRPPWCATPIGLASPDGTPPVGGWLDDEPPPTVSHAGAAAREPARTAAAATAPRRHRVTVRSVLFVVAIVAILGIALGGITYYGRSGYYVGFVGDQVAVFKGQQGGVLWVDPTLDGTYPLRRADLSPAWQQNLDRTISFTSRAAADDWFHTLRIEPRGRRDRSRPPRRRSPRHDVQRRRRRHHHDGLAHGTQRTVIASQLAARTELGLVLLAALVTDGRLRAGRPRSHGHAAGQPAAVPGHHPRRCCWPPTSPPAGWRRAPTACCCRSPPC